MAVTPCINDVKAFGQSSCNCCRSQAVPEFRSLKPFPVAAPRLYLHIPAGHWSLEPFSSLLSSTRSIFSPRRSFDSGKLHTCCDETCTWFTVSQGQLFFSELPLCFFLRWNEKVLANRSLRSHFCFWLQEMGDFAQTLLRCNAELYLCQQVIKKLKRSKKIMWKK